MKAKKDKSQDGEHDKEKITRLGELVFNGNIIFLSISFGLFTLSIDNIGRVVNISSVIVYSVFVAIMVLASILSLGLSYFGIRDNNQRFVNWATAFLFIVIIITILLYAQMYMKVLETNSSNLGSNP